MCQQERSFSARHHCLHCRKCSEAARRMLSEISGRQGCLRNSKAVRENPSLVFIEPLVCVWRVKRRRTQRPAKLWFGRLPVAVRYSSPNGPSVRRAATQALPPPSTRCCLLLLYVPPHGETSAGGRARASERAGKKNDAGASPATGANGALLTSVGAAKAELLASPPSAASAGRWSRAKSA